MKISAMTKENKMKLTTVIIFISICEAHRQWHDPLFTQSADSSCKNSNSTGGKTPTYYFQGIASSL
jgi:hypothetical protein